MKVTQQQWPLDRVLAERRQVLAQWPTGRGVDLEEAIAYHRQLPPARNAALALARAREEGRVLIQPRAGVALLEEHIALLRHLQEKGGADLLPTTIDSYTRNRRFSEADAAITQSRERRRSMLNRLPRVRYSAGRCALGVTCQQSR